MTKTQCPEGQILRKYVLGECPDDLSEVVERHVEECPSCEETIAQFDNTSDTLMRHLPLAAAAKCRREQAAAGWIDVLRGQPPTDATAGVPVAEQPDAAALAFPGAAANHSRPTDPVEAISQLADGFANYEILGVLGRGGMGVVFLARHKQLNRRVALKVVRPDAIASDVARRRFQREIQILGGLNHPGIVMATDAGIVGRGAYLVMEWIDGADFARLVRNSGPLSVESACEAGRQIAEALAAAHNGGVVHRDVKPSNTMVDMAGRVRLLDFGLAHMTRLMQESGDTSVGHLLGTLDYMAPEQAEGERQLDARADLYALGAILFFLLTGRPPHGSRSGRSILEHIRAVSQDEAPRISSIRVDIPIELENLIHRLLSRDPADRPQSATEVALSLTNWAGNDLASRVAEFKKSSAESVQESADSIAARQSLAELLGDGLPPSISTQSSIALNDASKVPPIHRRRFPLWAYFAPLAIMLAAGVTVLLKMQNGTLKIESEVDGVSVELVDEKEQVRELKIKRGDTETTLSAGQYRIRIAGTHDGVELDQDTITLRRGVTQVARVTRVKDPAPVSARVADVTTTERLFQGKSESEWQRQFKLETDHVTKLESAKALLSLASALPPQQRIERILDIGEELVEVGWRDRPSNFAFAIDGLGPSWPYFQTQGQGGGGNPLTLAIGHFQSALNEQIQKLPADDLASTLSLAVINGSNPRAAFAASLLSGDARQTIIPKNAIVVTSAVETIQTKLKVQLPGDYGADIYSRYSIGLLLRAEYAGKLMGEQRHRLLAELEGLTSVLNDSPTNASGKRLISLYQEKQLSSPLLSVANQLYGPDWSPSLATACARLVLKTTLNPGIASSNPFSATFANVSRMMGGGMGGGMGGVTPGTYSNSQIKDLRQRNRHFLDFWAFTVNEYLEQHPNHPIDSKLISILQTLDTTTRVFSDGDNWPLDKSAQLLTKILKEFYDDSPDKDPGIRSDESVNTVPALLLTLIVRITGEIPDFVQKGQPRSAALRKRLSEFKAYLALSTPSRDKTFDTVGRGLSLDAPYEAVTLLCYSGKISHGGAVQLPNNVLQISTVMHALASVGILDGNKPIDALLLLKILDGLISEKPDLSGPVTAILMVYRGDLKDVLESSLKVRLFAERSIRKMAAIAKEKKTDFTAIEELLSTGEKEVSNAAIPTAKSRPQKTNPIASMLSTINERLYQGKSGSDWMENFQLETEPVSKLNAALALLSLNTSSPASEKLELILELGEKIVEAGWDDRPFEFALDSTTRPPFRTSRWKINTSKEPEIGTAYVKYQGEINEQIGRFPPKLLATELVNAALKGSDARAAFAISLLRFAAKSQIIADADARQIIWSKFDVPLTGIDRSFLLRIIQLDYLRDATSEQRIHAASSLKEMASLLLKADDARLNAYLGNKLLVTAEALYRAFGSEESDQDWPNEVSVALARLVLHRLLEPSFRDLPLQGGFWNDSNISNISNERMCDDEDKVRNQSLREFTGYFLNGWISVVNEFLEEHQLAFLEPSNGLVVHHLHEALKMYKPSDNWPVETTRQRLTEILRSQYADSDENLPDQLEMTPQTTFLILSDIVMLTGKIPDFILKGHHRSKVTSDALEELEREVNKESPNERFGREPNSYKSLSRLRAIPFESFRLFSTVKTRNGTSKGLWLANFVFHFWQEYFGFRTGHDVHLPLQMAIVNELSGTDAETDARIAMILASLFGQSSQLPDDEKMKTYEWQVTRRLMDEILAKSKSGNLTKLIRDLIPFDAAKTEKRH